MAQPLRWPGTAQEIMGMYHNLMQPPIRIIASRHTVAAWEQWETGRAERELAERIETAFMRRYDLQHTRSQRRRRRR